jgi:hypothetical protein
MHFSVFQQVLDRLLEEIGTALGHWHQQHEQKAQPFDILRVADAELGA